MVVYHCFGGDIPKSIQESPFAEACHYSPFLRHLFCFLSWSCGGLLR